VKTVLATITDETHALLEELKAKRGFSNNNDMIETLIKEAAAKEEPQ